MTGQARAHPDPLRLAVPAVGGAMLVLAVTWLAGIGHAPAPPDPLLPLEARLAAVEARAIPDLLPALARADAAAAAAAEARRAALDQGAALDRRLIALEASAQAEERRVAALEEAARRPVVDPTALAAVAARVDRLSEGAAARDARDAEQDRARDLLTRALELRIGAAERSTADRVAALEAATGQRLAGAEAGIAARADTLERGLTGRLAAVEGRERRVVDAETRLTRLIAVGAARMALEEGRPLGATLAALPDPPAALARFAEAAPPTEASLRLSFPEAARAARAAAEPERGGGMLDAAAQRLGGLVTIRRGEELLLGNPAEATLDLARRAIEAGDLAGAVDRLARLPGASRAAMGGWMAEAEGLLAARSALARLAGG
jgi:hypothetical protein